MSEKVILDETLGFSFFAIMLWDASGQINLWFQSILGDPRWLLPVTHAGDRIYLLLLIPVVYYAIGRQEALFLLFVTTATFYINSFLKLLFQQPRPFWVAPMGIYTFEGSFGLPSGHAQNSLVVWGLLAVILVRRGIVKPMAALSFTTFLVFLISVSRIVFGAHFLQDTLSGWLIGFVVLALVLLLEKPLGSWFTGQNRVIRMMTIAGSAAGLYGLALLLMPDSVDAIPELARWNETARLSVETTPYGHVAFHDLNPLSKKAFLAVCGLLGGAAVAVGFPAPTAQRHRKMGAALTLLLLGLLYSCTGLFFPAGGWIGDVLYMIRYLLLVLFALIVMPHMLAHRHSV